MFKKPEFITFTGVDDYTDIDEMRDLVVQYPIEWGVLFSPSGQGKKPRYPKEESLEQIAKSGLRLSAHLCGGHSRDIMEGKLPLLAIPLAGFQRIQVNSREPLVWQIEFYQRAVGIRCAAQTRGPAFPQSYDIDWLFDASGGRGETPESWPPYPGRLVGYAGGLNPHNVLEALEKIQATGPYWIDMESGVRTDEKFDLELCRQVCEAVYPASRRVKDEKKEE